MPEGGGLEFEQVFLPVPELESEMNTKDAIRATAGISDMVVKTYLSDLADADLMRRPGKGCNHLAWQLGHLISSEVQLLAMVAPGKGIELPAGFADAHAKAQCENDDPAAFANRQTYLELYDKVRAASLAALDTFSDADFDKPGPERMRSLCPTVGHMFTLIATHPLMHAGQFVVVRRQLGKPVLI
jgi:hypothetical protein